MIRKELRPDWKRVGFGVSVSGVTTVCLTGAGAWLMHRELIGTEWMNYLAAGILLLSAIVGGAAAGRRSWIDPALSGAGLWLLLAIVNGLCFEMGLRGALPTALAVFGGTGVNVLVGGGKRSGRSRGRRYRNR